jgi:predicted transcriptional regulator
MALTELQLAIMDVLWEHEGAVLTDIHDALRRDRDIAQSTVATLLYRLEDRGVIERWQEGRKYHYRATVSRRDVRRSVVIEFADRTERLFAGDVAGLVSQLLSAGDFDADDLARAREMIAERERELEEADR